MENIIVEAKNLKKSYKMSRSNIVRALQDINLKINKGEFVAIVGPSGGGKSTLMHILGLLDRADEGELRIGGENINKIKEGQANRFRSKKIGFIFQGFNLLPSLTALENVMLAGKYGGLNKTDRREQAIKLLEMVGLGDRINHKPNELSGGQQQRVAIARALINNPAIIFADEPTGELDSKNSLEIMELLKKFNKEHNQTFVIVTHNPEVAAQCQRKITLKDGKVV